MLSRPYRQVTKEINCRFQKGIVKIIGVRVKRGRLFSGAQIKHGPRAVLQIPAEIL